LPPSRKDTVNNDSKAILSDRFAGTKNKCISCSVLAMMMQKKLTAASFAVSVYTSLWAVKWPQ
jgi:hypothetical protein